LDGPPPKLDFDTASFFDGFDVRFCKQWRLIGQSAEPETPIPATAATCTLAEVQDSDEAVQPFNTQPDEAADDFGFPSLDTSMEPFTSNWEGSGFDWSGSWLLNI
jgi:hypothetical protein